MISCIIDVICALVNPFSLIFAIIRLFGTCLPDFILIFPQFAIPAKIMCIIKIILSIVDYILNVIVPIIEEIISNIQNLYEAFAKKNEDAQAAIAFKIVALFKEIFNILGILTALLPLWEMVKALLKLGIGIPCGGKGGSCVGCGDDQCPEAIQQYNIAGNDGVMTVGNLLGSNFELNVMMPVMAHAIIESVQLLSSAINNFTAKCVSGIEPNKERLHDLAEASIATCTALAPIIGYDKAADLAKKAFKSGKPLRQVAEEEKALPKDELDKVLDLMSMTKPGI
jgi:aspartate ammonia-lyase